MLNAFDRNYVLFVMMVRQNTNNTRCSIFLLFYLRHSSFFNSFSFHSSWINQSCDKNYCIVYKYCIQTFSNMSVPFCRCSVVCFVLSCAISTPYSRRTRLSLSLSLSQVIATTQRYIITTKRLTVLQRLLVQLHPPIKHPPAPTTPPPPKPTTPITTPEKLVWMHFEKTIVRWLIEYTFWWSQSNKFQMN